MSENEDDGLIRRAKKPASAAPPPAAAPAPAPAPAPSGSAGGHDGTVHGGACPSCTRLRSALRAARMRLHRLAEENKTLREELLSAGEMIENLAQDLEKPY